MNTAEQKLTEALRELTDQCAALDAVCKDAERYRKWRAAYTNPDGRPHEIDPMLAALADAWTPEQVDAAIDAAMAKETKWTPPTN